jgi:hypothetical protein
MEARWPEGQPRSATLGPLNRQRPPRDRHGAIRSTAALKREPSI